MSKMAYNVSSGTLNPSLTNQLTEQVTSVRVVNEKKRERKVHGAVKAPRGGVPIGEGAVTYPQKFFFHFCLAVVNFGAFWALVVSTPIRSSKVKTQRVKKQFYVPVGQLSHMADISVVSHTQTHISEQSNTHAAYKWTYCKTL